MLSIFKNFVTISGRKKVIFQQKKKKIVHSFINYSKSGPNHELNSLLRLLCW